MNTPTLCQNVTKTHKTHDLTLITQKYENLSKKAVTINMFCYEYTLSYVRMLQKRTKHTNQR